jgi:hypothetical protein
MKELEYVPHHFSNIFNTYVVHKKIIMHILIWAIEYRHICYIQIQILPRFINIIMQAHIRNPEIITATGIRIDRFFWFRLP